jgi:hypothetical protein
LIQFESDFGSGLGQKKVPQPKFQATNQVPGEKAKGLGWE